MAWTGKSDIRKQLSRLWERGELLREHAAVEKSFPRKLRFKSPSSRDFSDRYEDVIRWIQELRKLEYVRIESKEINHSVIGKNSIPKEIWIDTASDAIRILRKQDEERKFLEIIEKTVQQQPVLLEWLRRKPLRALEHFPIWSELLDVVDWIKVNPCSGLFLRQVDIPKIDTKFIESNISILCELMLEATGIGDKNSRSENSFINSYGFRRKPNIVRFRILDATKNLLPHLSEFQDLSLDSDNFAMLEPDVSNVFIVENEINFLSFQKLPDSIVVFGGGYGIEGIIKCDWLNMKRVFYWGDIDTHGFAILNSARKSLPEIHSILMSEDTLMLHRECWVKEKRQHPGDRLEHLLPDEYQLFTDLKFNKWGECVRLEQERIKWDYAWSVITECTIDSSL